MGRSVTNPWHVSEAGFPQQGSRSEQFRHLLHYAVVAPSGHNTQPWLFRVTNDAVELFADRTRALPIVDPADRELTMSCAAALGQLRLAIRHCRVGRSPRSPAPQRTHSNDEARCLQGIPRS